LTDTASNSGPSVMARSGSADQLKHTAATASVTGAIQGAPSRNAGISCRIARSVADAISPSAAHSDRANHGDAPPGG
jgi:hypothetical protein